MEPVFDLQKKSILLLIFAHLVLGVVVFIIPVTTFYWQLLVIGFGSIHILQTKDGNRVAAKWAAYLAGMEVFCRMAGQPVFWEFGKYGVILFLLIGLAMNNYGVRYTYALYFLLLVPSLFIAGYKDFAQARDMISFNLSGPLCLAVSGLYFYKRRVSGPTLLILIRVLILPVLAMVSYLFFITPDYSLITFGTGSNFGASGGYGPNQVSLILGVCVFFIIILRYYDISFSGFRWLDYVLIGVLLFRALVTFSRGGVLGAAIGLGAFLLLNLTSGRSKRMANAMTLLVVMMVFGLLVWNYTNAITADALTYRYEGINQQTGMEEEYSTGRVMVMERDLTVFQQYVMMGIGPGKSKLATEYTKGREIASHTEWSRLLAEHGLFGLLALLLLIFVPLVHIVKAQQASRALLMAFLLLSFFSMFHSAMRLAVIGYLYAWALIIPVSEKNIVHRK